MSDSRRREERGLFDKFPDVIQERLPLSPENADISSSVVDINNNNITTTTDNDDDVDDNSLTNHANNAACKSLGGEEFSEIRNGRVITSIRVGSIISGTSSGELNQDQVEDEESGMAKKFKLTDVDVFMQFLDLFKQSFHYCKFLAKGRPDAVYLTEKRSPACNSSVGSAQLWFAIYHHVKNNGAKGLKYFKMAEENIDLSYDPLDSCWFQKVLIYADSDMLLKILKDLFGRIKIKLNEDKFNSAVSLKSSAGNREFIPLEYILVGCVALDVYERFRKKKKESMEVYYFLKFSAVDCGNSFAKDILIDIKSSRIQQETRSPAVNQPGMPHLPNDGIIVNDVLNHHLPDHHDDRNNDVNDNEDDDNDGEEEDVSDEEEEEDDDDDYDDVGGNYVDSNINGDDGDYCGGDDGNENHLDIRGKNNEKPRSEMVIETIVSLDD